MDLSRFDHRMFDMIWTKVDLTPAQEQKFWEDWLVGQQGRVLLHNQLVSRVESLRDRLSSCTHEELDELQAGVQECLLLLDFIHSRESEDVKKQYVKAS